MGYDNHTWWVRLPTDDSNEHRAKPLIARALRDTLWRYAKRLDSKGKPVPGSGELIRGKTQGRALQDLLAAMSTHPDEWEQVMAAVELWVEDGFLTWRRKGRWHALCITDYVERQTGRSKAAVRMQRYRARKKKSKESRRDTNRNASVTRDVTSDVTSDATRDGLVTLEKRREEKTKNIYTSGVTRYAESEADEGWIELARDYATDPLTVGLEHGEPHTWPGVREVIAAWDKAWGTETHIASSGDRRVRVLLDRLVEGRGPGTLIRALQAAAQDEWLADKPKLRTPGWVLGDADRVDAYLRVAASPPTAKGGKAGARAVQPAAETGYYDSGGGFERWTGGADDDPPKAAGGGS